MTCTILAPAAPLCAAEEKGAGSAAAPAAATRFCERHATLILESDDIPGVLSKAAEIAAQHDGYVTVLRHDASEHTSQVGRIVLRVPAASLDKALSEMCTLGEVRYESRSTENLATAVLDARANVAKLRDEEQRLLGHMRRWGKLEDLLELERRLGETRGEIEQQEGKLRELLERVAFAQITVTAKQNVTEADIAQATGKASQWRAKTVFRLAFSALCAVGRGLASVAIWLGVFSVIWLPLAIIGWLAARRRSR